MDVRETFRHHEVLLTGANGFLGKVLLGLLLDRYPEIQHTHILIRARRGRTAADRFAKEVVGSPALAEIARKKGEDYLRDRISVWAGDVSQPGCGLSEEDVARLTGRVALIINCAGLVEFYPPVDDSLRSNVDGPTNVVALAKRLTAKLLHISTCFVCGQADGLVEESDALLGFYPHRKGPEDLSFNHRDEVEHCWERVRHIYESFGFPAAKADGNGTGRPSEMPRSKKLRQKLIALGRHRAEHWGWTNTYTYSKSLGEQIVASEPGLEWAIVRPAIVESALRFPFPGWIEGGRTAAPLVLMALGGMKDWPVRRDAPLEVVPVDLVASAVLVVGALLLEGRHTLIYQLGSADVNPLMLGPLVKLVDVSSRELRRRRVNGIPAAFLVDPPRPFEFVLPEQARARRIQLEKRIRRAQTIIRGVRKTLEATGLPGKQKLHHWSTALRTYGLQAAFREQTLEQYLPFILYNRFIFECENIRDAYGQISERDRVNLPWDPERIDWAKYWTANQMVGIEKWIRPDATKDWAFQI